MGVGLKLPVLLGGQTRPIAPLNPVGHAFEGVATLSWPSSARKCLKAPVFYSAKSGCISHSEAKQVYTQWVLRWFQVGLTYERLRKHLNMKTTT